MRRITASALTCSGARCSHTSSTFVRIRRCSDRRSRFQPRSLNFSAKCRAHTSVKSGLVRQAVIADEIPLTRDNG
jgi:hypothetical protein